MRRVTTAFILTALTTVASFAAEPQTATITKGDTQLNLRFGAIYVGMDVANGLGTVINEGDYTFITQAENGATISAPGFLMGVDYWGQGLGEGGFYLGAGLLNVSYNNSLTTTLPASGFLDLLPIDGRTSPGLLVNGAGTLVNFATKTSFHRFDGAAGYALPDMADGINLALGLYGAQSHLTLDALITGPSGGASLSKLSEQVTTLSIGPMVAFQHTTALSDTLDGFVEAQAALLYASGRLEAHQSAIKLPTDIALSSQTGNLAGMIDIRAGVTTPAFGDGKLTLFGGIGLRNDVYSIVNPRSSAGLEADSAASYHPGPATLQQTMQFSASVGARFVFKF